MKKSKWYKYYLCNFQRSACAKLKLNKQALPIKYKKDFISIDEANEYVIELIQSGKPFVMGRLGETEARSAADALGIKYGCKKIPKRKDWIPCLIMQAYSRTVRKCFPILN